MIGEGRSAWRGDSRSAREEPIFRRYRGPVNRGRVDGLPDSATLKRGMELRQARPCNPVSVLDVDSGRTQRYAGLPIVGVDFMRGAFETAQPEWNMLS